MRRSEQLALDTGPGLPVDPALQAALDERLQESVLAFAAADKLADKPEYVRRKLDVVLGAMAHALVQGDSHLWPEIADDAIAANLETTPMRIPFRDMPLKLLADYALAAQLGIQPEQRSNAMWDMDFVIGVATGAMTARRLSDPPAPRTHAGHAA